MEVRFPPDLQERVDRAAARLGRDSESLVREAVESFVDTDERFHHYDEKAVALPDAIQINNALPPRYFELRWLAENRAAYAGKWVALERGRLVSVGDDAQEVYETALRQGLESPFVARVELLDTPSFGGW